MEKLRAAVVGCGSISARHLESLAENEKCVISAVCDIIGERADKAASEYKAKPFYDIDDMLSWGEFDVLHICTPHYLHAPMALKAMKAKKHVLCEKPLAIFYKDALEMCECAEQNGVYLGVCFQNRYNPASVYIKSLLDSGELGAVVGLKGSVTWNRNEDYYSADDWHGTLLKEGGGVVINQSIHTIDLLQWFAGSEITEVRGSVSQKKLMGKVETEDTADALIRFSDGVSALFYGTLCYTENSPVFIEISCEKGKIIMYDDLVIYRNGEKKAVSFDDKATGKKSYWGLSHTRLIDDFYSCVLSDKPFMLSGREGIKAVKIVDGLYKDARKQ